MHGIWHLYAFSVKHKASKQATHIYKSLNLARISLEVWFIQDSNLMKLIKCFILFHQGTTVLRTVQNPLLALQAITILMKRQGLSVNAHPVQWTTTILTMLKLSALFVEVRQHSPVKDKQLVSVLVLGETSRYFMYFNSLQFQVLAKPMSKYGFLCVHVK